MIHQFNFPTIIRFGAGARRESRSALAQDNASRPLIVTDSGIVDLPVFEQYKSNVDGPDIEVGVYSEFSGNPLVSHVTAGVEAYRAHDADAIIGFGGGAALDVAKAIAVMVHHPGHLFDYEDGKPDARPVDQEIPPIIAVPTTAGTGSEVGRSSVISDDETHAKKIIFSPRMLPGLVLADPELLLGLPPHLTASTGMDALTHNVEAYLAKGYHPMCDGIALEGVRLVAGHLRASVEDGSNLEARTQMMAASLMGAVAFQKGLGATHSLAHALSTVLDMHHGLANGILIPYVMRFNNEAVPDRMANLARAALAESPSGSAFVQWLVQLKEDIGIPATLTDVGVKQEHLDQLSAVAFEDICHHYNPRQCNREDLRTIYEDAILG